MKQRGIMANYACIRVVTRPVKGKEEDYERLCEVVQDSDEFIESIEGDSDKVWLDIDYFEPSYDENELWFQLIAKWNYPRYELEEGMSDNYTVDYDIVFADEFETYEIDYSSYLSIKFYYYGFPFLNNIPEKRLPRKLKYVFSSS